MCTQPHGTGNTLSAFSWHPCRGNFYREALFLNEWYTASLLHILLCFNRAMVNTPCIVWHIPHIGLYLHHSYSIFACLCITVAAHLLFFASQLPHICLSLHHSYRIFAFLCITVTAHLFVFASQLRLICFSLHHSYHTFACLCITVTGYLLFFASQLP